MTKFSGHLRLRAEARAAGRTVLAAQDFRAPYHLSKPYWDSDTSTLLVQIVNPTAGILEGDALDSDIQVAAGASLLITTPSASRVFKMKNGSATCRQRFTVATGGWLEVLPEPVIPHRGCRYHQITRVEASAGAGLFFVDLLTAGRVAHRGEAWVWDRLCMETEVRVDGELVLRERFDQSGAELRALATLGGSGPTVCFGNAVLIGDGEASWLPAIAALHRDGVWVGASPLRRGGWSIKFVTVDSIRLRRTLRSLREILAATGYPRLACATRKL